MALGNIDYQLDIEKSLICQLAHLLLRLKKTCKMQKWQKLLLLLQLQLCYGYQIFLNISFLLIYEVENSM